MISLDFYNSYSTQTEPLEQPITTDKIYDQLNRSFQGYNPTQENSRLVLQYKWSTEYLPEEWSRHDFTEPESSLVTPCFSARVDNPIAEIRFSLGFKSIPQAYQRIAHFWNALDYDVSFMMLPYTDRTCNFIKSYDRAQHTFLTNENLDIHKDSQPDIPKIILTHSTAGLCLGRNRLAPLKEEVYNSQYAGIINISPFFGMTGITPSSCKKIYERFQKHLLADQTPNWRTGQMETNNRLDLLPTETLIGQICMHYLRYYKREPQVFTSLADPTFRQMRELALAGEEYCQAIEETSHSLLLPTHFFIPKYDTVACPERQKSIAQSQGASTTILPYFHNPILESPFHALKEVTHRIGAIIAPAQDNKLILSPETQPTLIKQCA